MVVGPMSAVTNLGVMFYAAETAGYTRAQYSNWDD